MLPLSTNVVCPPELLHNTESNSQLSLESTQVEVTDTTIWNNFLLYLEIVIDSIPVLTTLIQGNVIVIAAIVFLKESDTAAEQVAVLGLYNTMVFITFELWLGAIDEKTGIVLARSFGKKKKESFKINVFCSIEMFILSSILLPNILYWPIRTLALPDAISPLGMSQLDQMFLYSIPAMILKSISTGLMNIGYCQSISSPYSILYVILLLLNISLLYIFMVTFQFGCIGVVYSILIAESIGLCCRIYILLWFTDTNYLGLPMSIMKAQLHLREFIYDCTIFTIAEYCEAIGFQVPIFLIVLKQDIVWLNSYVEAISFLNISVSISIAIAISYNVKVNQILGAGLRRNGKRYFLNAFYWTFLFGSLFGLITFIFCEFTAGLYSRDAEVKEALSDLLKYAAIIIPFDLSFELLTSTLRTLGKTKWLIISSLVFCLLMNTIIGYLLGFVLMINNQVFMIVYSICFVLCWVTILVGDTKTNWELAELSLEEFSEDRELIHREPII